jgi:uncharacterized membrane protein YhfC
MKRIIFISLILLGLLMTSCSPDPFSQASSNIDKGSYATGVAQNASGAGQWKSGFRVNIQEDNHPVGVLLRGTSTSGSLTLTIQTLAGEIAWKSASQGGTLLINEVVADLPKGEYELVVTWDGPLSANFDLYMVPGERIILPSVRPAALIGGSGMILVALGFLVYAGSRRLGWRFIGLGALSWFITVAVKFVIAIPLNPILYKLLVTPDSPGIGDWVFNLYVGLLTGITEILMVWLLLRFTRLGQAGWNKALGFGIGFGAVEALLLGVSSFGSVLAALLIPAQIPLNAMASLSVGNNLLVGLAPIWERFFTVWVHILSNVLLFYAATTRKNRYFWMAFWYKSILDLVAAYAQMSGISSLVKMWSIEAFIALMGVLGYWGTVQIQKMYAGLSPKIPPAPSEV